MAEVTLASLKAKWITGYVPTQADYVDLFDTLGCGWQRVTLELTQDDVRTLSSANSGYGYKMFDAAGNNKIIQIANPIFKLGKTAGSYAGSLSIITSTDADLIMNSSATISDSNTHITMFEPNIAGGGERNYILNSDIFLYGGDNPDFEGTATMIVDYREIDFS